MNPTQPPTPPPAADFSSLQADINSAVGSHRRKMKLLTGAALLFALLSLVASIGIVAGYFVFIHPKQVQMLNNYTHHGNPPPAAPAAAPAGTPPGDSAVFAAEEVVMTYVGFLGTMLVAIAVGLSAAGTLVMLVLMVLQRRATLQQINLSLTRISAQLEEMKPPKTEG